MMFMLTCNVTDMFQSQHLKRQWNSGAYLLIAMVSCCSDWRQQTFLNIFARHHLRGHENYQLYYIT